MAGIGFVLRKLSRRDDLLGILQGFAHSSLASTGPWVFTVLALSGIFLVGTEFAGSSDLFNFRLIIIYNFAFSLVLSGPLVMLVTRCLADRIFEMDVRQAPGMLVGSMAVLFAVQLPVAVFFYFWYFELDAGTRIAAFMNFYLISGIWLIGVFLTALKNYRSVSYSFAFGMALAVVGALTLGPAGGVPGMLAGFNIGLGWILFTLVAQVLAEYPYPVQSPFAFFRYLRRYWELALSGLIYNLGIWVDKWVMWTAPEAEVLESGMISFPDYDSAIFLAYLSIIPSIAVFVFSIETSFFEKYLRFYRDIRRHASLDKIRENHRALIRDMAVSGRNFLVLQGSLCIVLVLMAPRVFEALNVAYVQMGIFRLGLFGAVFHCLFLFISIILSYFDLRRITLYLQILFLVSNGLFTWLSLQAGFSFYGYGYAMACIVTAAASFVALTHYVEELPYQTFVGGNAAVR